MKKKVSLLLVLLIIASVFNIVSVSAAKVKKIAKIRQTAATSNSVSLKWSKVSKYAKYEIKLSNQKNAKRRYKKISKNKYKITKLKPGKTYAIKIRAKVHGVKGPWSSVYKIVTAPKISYTWDSFKLKAKWTDMNRATSYNLKLRLNSDKKKFVRVKNVKGTEYTFTKKQLAGLCINKVYNIFVLPFENKTKLFTGKTTTRDMEITGHRGRMDIAPENTLVSFKEAHKAGYDSFESDYFATNSGDAIISHDRILKQCNSNADIRTLTINDIKKYPIVKGVNVKKYDTQYLPTVEQAIKAASEYKMKVYFHTKDSNTPDKVFKKIAASIKKYKMEDKVTVFARNETTFKRIVKQKIRAGFLNLPNNTNDVKKSLKFAGTHSAKVVIFKYCNYINADVIKLAHKYKLKFGCYNIHTKSTASDFANMQGDFLITNKNYFN